MKRSKFMPILVIVLIISLGLNILLIYNLKNIDTKDCNIETGTDKTYTKYELGELFKEYQSNNNLADSDNVVVWDVDKITYKGFFPSDGRKLYVIEETYSCLEGTTCVNATSTTIDENYNVKAIFYVALNDNNSDDMKFYILDESIMKNNDFVEETEYELK